MKTKILPLFLIIISFLVNPHKTAAQVNVQDSLALVDYYDSTYGVAPWQTTQWNLQDPVNTWSGVGVSNGRVVSILLWGGGGAGTIPATFGNLTALKSINFLDNRLTGPLPDSFKNLISLNDVHFHTIFDHVPFPEVLTKVPNLSEIDIQTNYFTDSIPASIGNMASLVSLNLTQNTLSGTIPVSINSLNTLTSVDISYNNYTFKELIPFIDDYVASNKTYSLNYSPQSNIPVHRNNNKLSVSAGGNLNDDTFKWYKDNVLVATVTGDSTYAILDTGSYHVEITNSIITDLTLYSDEINLHYLMPVTETSGTIKIISGTAPSPVNITNGIFEIAKVQPTLDGYPLSGIITAQVNIDSSIKTFNDKPYVQRHYDITPAENADISHALITLYFTQEDFDNYNNYVTENDLNLPLLPTGGVDNGNVHITQFHGSFTGSSSPENYGDSNTVLIIPSVVWDNVNQWWVVSFPVSGFSGFFISTGNILLPLKLLNFSGKLQSNSINLQWLTSGEDATKEFKIERSADGNTFNNIGAIVARSTSNNNSYSFTDTAPLDGINFYRLKMIDKDGKFTYSNVIREDYSGIISLINFYPNPASAILNIKITSNKNEKITLYVMDASGKLTLKKNVTVTNGVTQTTLNIEKWTSGSYFLYTVINGVKQNIEFIKNK